MYFPVLFHIKTMEVFRKLWYDNLKQSKSIFFIQSISKIKEVHEYGQNEKYCLLKYNLF